MESNRRFEKPQDSWPTHANRPSVKPRVISARFITGTNKRKEENEKKQDAVCDGTLPTDIQPDYHPIFDEPENLVTASDVSSSMFSDDVQTGIDAPEVARDFATGKETKIRVIGKHGVEVGIVRRMCECKLNTLWRSPERFLYFNNYNFRFRKFASREAFVGRRWKPRDHAACKKRYFDMQVTKYK
ncbi:unnamed protein product [Haemonchus placei]|uniref:HSF_DOMAIN domain-containing protein n=1 Tax=Haemonchus placei TaxID=6290 RepID=A0A0N4W9L9_HAEPC|nr:unnamed protein product [Haemonchus placei]